MCTLCVGVCGVQFLFPDPVCLFIVHGSFFSEAHISCAYMAENICTFLTGTDRRTDGLTLCMQGKGVNCPIHSSASISKGADGVLTAGNAPNELT